MSITHKFLNDLEDGRPGLVGVLLETCDGDEGLVGVFLARQLDVDVVVLPQLGDDGVYGRNFRSVHFEVPDERVAVFKRNLEEKRLATLVEPMGPVTRTLENGDVVNVICLDDASLRAKYLAPQSVWSVSRHNCRGRTDIDDFADSLFDLAVEFDPTLEPYRFTLPKGD